MKEEYMEQLTITAKIQIITSDTYQEKLNTTMSVYCAACNYVSDYVFKTQTPFFTSTNPTTALMISISCTIKYNGTIGKAVNRARINAAGMVITHTYAQSNRKVITVLPPQRMVK